MRFPPYLIILALFVEGRNSPRAANRQRGNERYRVKAKRAVNDRVAFFALARLGAQ
jgi:hypothetical protein